MDQGFEHGPARSFAPNPPGYDPRYHFSLACDAGCNAYAAPLGFLEAGAAEFAGEIPLILKLNNHDVLHDARDPEPAVTGSVSDALRLGCAAIGYTIYPGSSWCVSDVRAVARDRRGSQGARPGGSGVVLPARLGHQQGRRDRDRRGARTRRRSRRNSAPTSSRSSCRPRISSRPKRKKAYETNRIPIEHAERARRHVVQSAFNGRRIVIFSGGPKVSDEKLLDEVRAINAGGGFGSIIGRNSFQRPRAEAIKLLGTIMDIYAGRVCALTAAAPATAAGVVRRPGKGFFNDAARR